MIQFGSIDPLTAVLAPPTGAGTPVPPGTVMLQTPAQFVQTLKSQFPNATPAQQGKIVAVMSQYWNGQTTDANFQSQLPFLPPDQASSLLATAQQMLGMLGSYASDYANQAYYLLGADYWMPQKKLWVGGEIVAAIFVGFTSGVAKGIGVFGVLETFRRYVQDEWPFVPDMDVTALGPPPPPPPGADYCSQFPPGQCPQVPAE